MRFKLLLLFWSVTLSACSFNVQVFTPNPPAPSATIPASQTAAPTSTAFITEATSTPAPSSTPTFTPTVSSNSSPPLRVKFAANGTFVDLEDTIGARSGRTYVIEALKGQIMSVSILQHPQSEWAFIPMHIKGADGTILCPEAENAECSFWRGVLPASQDYFVDVAPVGADINITLRVAINPPGVANQYFEYSKGNKSLRYSDEFAPARFSGAQISKFDPEFTLRFIDSPFYTGTNLIEAYLLFGSSNDPAQVSTCTRPASLGAPETIVSAVDINGIRFTKSEATGVAAGNIYEQKYYRAEDRGVCYEVTFFIHAGNVGAYAPGTVEEFDRAALLKKFESVLSSLIIK